MVSPSETAVREEELGTLTVPWLTDVLSLSVGCCLMTKVPETVEL